MSNHQEPSVTELDLFFEEGQMLDLLTYGEVPLSIIPEKYGPYLIDWCRFREVQPILSKEEFRSLYSFIAMRDDFTTVREEEEALKLRAALSIDQPGTKLIRLEREKQIKKGFTPEHDEQHGFSVLRMAAFCYLLYVMGKTNWTDAWPFENKPKQPESQIAALAKAGALIAAEIDRIQRVESLNQLKSKPSQDQ